MRSSNLYIVIYREKYFKNLPPKNWLAKKAETCVEAISCKVNLNLFNPLSLGIGWSYTGGWIFTLESIQTNS